MEQKKLITPEDKIKNLDFMVKGLIKKASDLVWFSEHNEEKLLKTGRHDKLERIVEIKNKYPEAIKLLGSTDGKNWKGFYIGMLASARFLERHKESLWDFENSSCDMSFHCYIKDSLNFKVEYANEACSEKERNRWFYQKCPPLFKTKSVTKLVNGKKITSLEFDFADEPTPTLDEDGEFTYK